MTSGALAVIPARGGSKRIPRKNIRHMSGRPLIVWVIEVALSSGQFSEVIVSTDDQEISKIATEAGASVPFTRPSRLANDTATTGEVMAHAVEFMSNNGLARADVCCLYPSAIFIHPEDLTRSRELLHVANQQDGLQYVMSVVEFPHPIQRALRIGPDDVVDPVDPQFSSTRTQDLEPRLHDAGQFYWGAAEAWLKMQDIVSSAKAYPMPRGRVVDIDTEDDWLFAERIHSSNQKRPKG